MKKLNKNVRIKFIKIDNCKGEKCPFNSNLCLGYSPLSWGGGGKPTPIFKFPVPKLIIFKFKFKKTKNKKH